MYRSARRTQSGRVVQNGRTAAADGNAAWGDRLNSVSHSNGACGMWVDSGDECDICSQPHGAEAGGRRRAHWLSRFDRGGPSYR